MLRAISIPDVLPSDLPPGSDFSLVAGDFEEIYGSEVDEGEEPHSGQWNAILTCFFIDTVRSCDFDIRGGGSCFAPIGMPQNDPENTRILQQISRACLAR